MKKKSRVCKEGIPVDLGGMIEVKGERGREEDEWKWKGFVDEQVWNWEWE